MRRVVVIVSLVVAALGCSCDENPKKREREKMLDRYYEIEWVKCVNELGIDRCKVIQETGFRQCQNYKSSSNGGIDGCADERFKDRLKELEATESEKDEPQKAEAEEPHKAEPAI